MSLSRRAPIRPRSPIPHVELFPDPNGAGESISVEEISILMEKYGKSPRKAIDLHTLLEVLGQPQFSRSREHITRLFMRVNHDMARTISWEDFFSYISIDLGGRAQRPQTPALLFTDAASLLDAHHHDVVQRIDYAAPPCGSDGELGHELPGRFLSVSSDGGMCVWARDATKAAPCALGEMQRSVRITDFVVMGSLNKIAVALTNRSLRFYDVAAGVIDVSKTSPLLFEVVELEDNIVCLAFHVSSDPNRCTVIAGDSGGAVNTITFCTARTNLLPKTDARESRSLSFAQLFEPSRSHILLPARHKVHKEWVTKVCGYNSLGSFISCCASDAESLTIFDGSKTVASLSLRKGVCSFDYSRTWRNIVTGTADGVIRFWNRSMRCTAQLEGHKSAIVHIALFDDGVDSSTQIASISEDQVIKLWSMKEQVCLQTLMSHRYALGKVRVSTMLFRPDLTAFYVASSEIACFRLSDDSRCSFKTTHPHRLLTAMFSKAFNQVITVTETGAMSVWDIMTGARLANFSQLHGSEEIAAVALDTTQHKLLTASSEDVIKVWNFQSGRLLETYRSPDGAHTAVTCLTRTALDAVISADAHHLYGRRPVGAAALPAQVSAARHKGAILCLAVHPPALLATADDAGCVVLWRSEGLKEIVRFVPTPELAVSVEKLVFLGSRQRSSSAMLVGVGTHGLVRFWDALLRPVCWFHADDDHHDVYSLATNASNTILCTGDARGVVSVWDVSAYGACAGDRPPRAAHGRPPLLCSWAAHTGSVVALEVAGLGVDVIVSASADTTAKLWLDDGTLIGMFGQRGAWMVGDLETYAQLSVRRQSEMIAADIENVVKSVHPCWSYTSVTASDSKRDDELTRKWRTVKKSRDRLQMNAFNPLLGMGFNRLPFVPLMALPAASLPSIAGNIAAHHRRYSHPHHRS